MPGRTYALVLAMLLVGLGLHAADDPLMGTWKLNIAKSKLASFPMAKWFITFTSTTSSSHLNPCSIFGELRIAQ